MTSTYQNYPSQNLQEHVLFSPSNNIYLHDDAEANSSSPISLSTRDFFSSVTDQGGSYYDKELQPPHVQLDQVSDDFASNGGSCDQVENYENSDNIGLKFSIWKKEDHKYENHTSAYNHDQKSSTNFQVKWLSSKTRMMHKMKNTSTDHPTDVKTMHNKMKNTDLVDVNGPQMSTTLLKLEDDQKQPLSDDLMETDKSSNTTSSNTMIMSSINHPIRVCSDCNTTKTPLWRSGPQGPKSLCNACGIRQRKARRAMAAAAAANGTPPRTETKPAVLIKKNKNPQKNKTKTSSKLNIGSSSVVSKFKNRGTMTAAATTTSHSQDRKKLCLEDFLLSLSKNLAFHTVFPQDEKEAAILLMALSFGHVHG